MHSRTRSIGAAVVGGATLAVLLPLTASPALAAGPTFPSNPPIVFIGYDAPTTLATLVGSGGGYGLETYATAPVSSYNALGFNPVDGYLYGVSPTQQLLQIDLDGDIESLGTIALPEQVEVNQGTFGLDEGWEGAYFVRTVADTDLLWEIDVTDNSVVSHALSDDVPNVSDIVYRDGFIWAYDGRTESDLYFYRIDLADFSVDSFDASSLGLPLQPYGGQWLYGNGNIGLTGNITGQIFQIAIEGADTDAPTFSVVSTGTGEATTNNDAASILGEPADLALVKAGDATFEPGEAYSYTITVSNAGPGDSSGSQVVDELPAGLESPTTETEGCSIADGILECVHGPLAVDVSYQIVVNGVAADDATSESLTNSANVTGNEEDPNPGNNADVFTPDPVAELPDTGADVGILYAALALLAAGGVAVALRRRTRKA